MTGEILHDVLGSLNRELKQKVNLFILFILCTDNVECHPTDLAEKYSNIQVLFLPSNNASKLERLDLGYPKFFKLYYHKLFMRFVLATASDVTTAIT